MDKDPDFTAPTVKGIASPDSSAFPQSTAQITGHPIHPMLVPFPIACFVGTLLTDIAYLNTGNEMWSNFSSWLLTAGLIISMFAAIAGAIDFFSERRIRQLSQAWIHAAGNSLALLLAIWNAFVHTHDGYTAVWPIGITLSTLVVLILLVTGWNGWAMVYRHGVAVRPEKRR